MAIGAKKTAQKEVVTVWMSVKDHDGLSRQKGRETWSAIRAIEHELAYPWDPADASAGVGSAHGSLVVTRAIEPSTPELARALSKKSKIDEVNLEFEMDPGGGKTVVYYTIKLTDCRVTMHETFLGSTDQRAAGWPVHLERLGFGYTKIEWTYMDPKKLGSFNFTDRDE